MKVAFVGKGGSGKTTTSGLVCRYLAASGFPVLAIDADINQHLGRTIGMSHDEAETIPALGLEIRTIKDYLRGSNPLIEDSGLMIKTTPPGTGSRLLCVEENNPIYDYFIREANGVRLMAVGPFNEEDIGTKCYHGKIGSVELLLNHIIDKEREYIIVDMTAGADSFASGLFTRFDMTFLVVEPTIKSVSVYKQYKQYARDYDVPIKVIGNKVENEDDIDFLKENIGDDLIATIYQSSFVKNTDRGNVVPIADLEEANKNALKKIIAVIDAQKKDWVKFYRQANEFHTKNAEGWANVDFGKDLRKQIDPTFVIPV